MLKNVIKLSIKGKIMQKFKYITEISLVFLMSVSIILDIVNNGFTFSIASSILTVLILAGAFYENYSKDKIIASFKKNND